MKNIHLFDFLSLRMRITLLTGVLIGGISLLFTVLTIQNAQNQFLTPIYTLTPAIQVSTEAQAAPKTTVTPYPAFMDLELEPASLLPPSAESDDVPEERVSSAKIAVSVVVQKAVQMERIKTVKTITLAKQSFDSNTYLYLILFALLGMMLAYWISGSMLKPLRDLNESILHIHAHNLKERICVPSSYDEMGSLASSYNSMLERLDESFVRQQHFSANVSHELKTPLAIMNAGIQVLKLDETPSAEDYKETIDLLEHNTKRLTAIVEDLLLLTNEKELPQQEKLSLSKIIEQIHAELLLMYPQKSITFHTDLSFDTILGSRTLISRALFNLLDNAYKYSKSSGIVTVAALETNGQRQIQIKDDGPGIPKEDLPSIFDPFYRVDNSRSRKTAGSGLGLSIVKTILDKHHWSIDAHSCEPGISFRITLDRDTQNV